MGWTPYFESYLTAGSYPYYKHAQWDLCDVGWRFVEAWHMVRRVTGEPVSKEEEHLRTAVFSSIKEDGLSYRRKEAWSTVEAWMWDQGRALLTLCSLAEGNDKETAVGQIFRTPTCIPGFLFLEDFTVWRMSLVTKPIVI